MSATGMRIVDTISLAAFTPARKHGIYEPSTLLGLEDTPTALTSAIFTERLIAAM